MPEDNPSQNVLDAVNSSALSTRDEERTSEHKYEVSFLFTEGTRLVLTVQRTQSRAYALQ
jgi:hypothetical protein